MQKPYIRAKRYRLHVPVPAFKLLYRAQYTLIQSPKSSKLVSAVYIPDRRPKTLMNGKAPKRPPLVLPWCPLFAHLPQSDSTYNQCRHLSTIPRTQHIQGNRIQTIAAAAIRITIQGRQHKEIKGENVICRYQLNRFPAPCRPVYYAV